MRLRLPPHIGWPLLVVTLLCISISASVYTYVAANSGGGAQVVEDYYERALQWNEEVEQRSQASIRGWILDVEVVDADITGLRRTIILLSDSTGAGVEGVAGTVRLYRPHVSRAVAEIPLSRDEGIPGRYVQLLPIDQIGLWDLDLRLRDGPDVVTMRARIDVP